MPAVHEAEGHVFLEFLVLIITFLFLIFCVHPAKHKITHAACILGLALFGNNANSVARKLQLVVIAELLVA